MLEIGRIVKPHGLNGEVIVELVTDRTERLVPGTVFGDLEVVAARPHQHRWIVSFAGVVSRDAAAALRGRTLSAEPLVDPDALWVHELIGAEAVDTTGALLGRITAVEANPASDLLVLDSGALVPLAFLVERRCGRVVVDPPEGLLGPGP